MVVKRIDAEDKTAGGILIPDGAKEKPSQGEIIAVGPGGRDEAGKLIPIDVKTGDRVLFGKWSGTEVKLEGEELLIMKESDIMGIIDGGTGTDIQRRGVPMDGDTWCAEANRSQHVADPVPNARMRVG